MKNALFKNQNSYRIANKENYKIPKRKRSVAELHANDNLATSNNRESILRESNPHMVSLQNDHVRYHSNKTQILN